MPISSIPPKVAAVIQKSILTHEGGYVNNPADPGGETKYGISKRSYPQVDIRSLTLEQAVDIYYKDWWNRRLAFVRDLPSVAMAGKIFDIGINTGERQVVRLCQRALKTCGIRVSDDGAMGNMTLTALHNVEPEEFLQAFRQECGKFYQSLADAKPSLRRFLKGWLKRAYA